MARLAIEDDLTLNGKTQIFPFKNGVSYLGFHTYATNTGKVIRKLKNQNKRNAQRKFLKMAKLVDRGKLSEEKFYASYNAWKNHISHGNCYRLGRAMDERINEILKGVIDMYGYICPDCGAHLDPGEKCDCRKEETKNDKNK